MLSLGCDPCGFSRVLTILWQILLGQGGSRGTLSSVVQFSCIPFISENRNVHVLLLLPLTLLEPCYRLSYFLHPVLPKKCTHI